MGGLRRPGSRAGCEHLHAVGLALLLSACADPLGTERAEIVEHLARLEADCSGDLRLWAFRVAEVEKIVGVLREQTRVHVGQLRAMDGCGPCAEKLNASLESGHACTFVGDVPRAPSFETPPSKWDTMADLRQRRHAWEEYRARLDAWSRQKVSCELAFEDAVLGARILLGEAPDPSCVVCRVRLEEAGLLTE